MPLSHDSKKDELYEDLLQSVDREFSLALVPPPFHEWVKSITLDGKPFAYERHEYLIEPYKDNHLHQAEIKSTQMGLTSKAMLIMTYLARYGKYRGILYFFPSSVGVQKFCSGRFNPLIADNDSIFSWLGSTDSVAIKHIWNTFIYLLGMNSREGLKSTPGDFEIFDESDEAPPKAFDMAVKRMSHSEMKRFLMLSNPTLPDYGIDKAFQATDQRFWLLKCHKCNHYTDLVGTFPLEPNKDTPTLITLKDNRVIRVCEKCKTELNPSVGQWVAKKPAVTEKRGRQYSQLYSHFVDPADLLTEYRTTSNLQDFYNLGIGIAYTTAENRLSIEQVLDLCGSDGISSSDKTMCSMGVDQGTDLHVVIGKKHPRAFGQIVHIGVYKDWEELDRLMKNFHVGLCVVDALPEQRNARAFAERHKRKVYLNFYNERQKGSYAWNERERVISCNRTESLDASHREIMEELIILPRQCEITQEFAQHLHNVAKKLEEDEETGSKRYVYVKLGADHFRHAFNYETIARTNLPDYLFPGL